MRSIVTFDDLVLPQNTHALFPIFQLKLVSVRKVVSCKYYLCVNKKSKLPNIGAEYGDDKCLETCSILVDWNVKAETSKQKTNFCQSIPFHLTDRHFFLHRAFTQ